MDRFYPFLINHARNLRDFILSLLFPLECLGCGKEGQWLCAECFKKIPFNNHYYCLNCKKITRNGEFCPSCAPDFHLNGIWIAGSYDNKTIFKLIKNLKYYHAGNLADILGKYLSIFLQNLLNKKYLTNINCPKNNIKKKFNELEKNPLILLSFNKTIIIPVPLHKKRHLTRGFNQAEKLAKIISKNFNLKIDNNLKRIKHKKAQAKLKRKARIQNIKNCFNYQGNDLAGKNILLIDDVATTGATLNECANVLKGHNAGEIWGLVIAGG